MIGAARRGGMEETAVVMFPGPPRPWTAVGRRYRQETP